MPLPQWRGGGTILFADDVDLICEHFRDLLIAHGFDVIDVRNGAAAVGAFHAFGRDIVTVLMDHNMPRMTEPGRSSPYPQNGAGYPDRVRLPAG